jgi:hypothetical protein
MCIHTILILESAVFDNKKTFEAWGMRQVASRVGVWGEARGMGSAILI